MDPEALLLPYLSLGTSFPSIATIHDCPGSLSEGRMWPPQLPASFWCLPAPAGPSDAKLFLFPLLVSLGEAVVGGECSWHTHPRSSKSGSSPLSLIMTMTLF